MWLFCVGKFDLTSANDSEQRRFPLELLILDPTALTRPLLWLYSSAESLRLRGGTFCRARSSSDCTRCPPPLVTCFSAWSCIPRRPRESLRYVTSRCQGDQIRARVRYKRRRLSAERAQWLQHHWRGGSKPQPT
ncbi:hypothetical protein SRHO_G00282800 [Serrasalmus rhombeus]